MQTSNSKITTMAMTIFLVLDDFTKFLILLLSFSLTSWSMNELYVDIFSRFDSLGNSQIFKKCCSFVQLEGMHVAPNRISSFGQLQRDGVPSSARRKPGIHVIT